MSGIQASGAALPDSDPQGITSFDRAHRALFSKELQSSSDGLLDMIMKVDPVKSVGSSQGVSLGRKGHPFNFDMVSRFQSANVHHGRSIHAKVSATVGLGFRTENDRKKKEAKSTGMPVENLPAEGDEARIDTALDPFCEHSWQDVINDVCEDYWQTGNGYLEVVRDDSGQIAGLYHLPAKEVFVVIENSRYQRHYSVQGAEDGSGVRSFARFGDLEDFIRRAGEDAVTIDLAGVEVSKENTSEVIHFRRPTSLSRWYGFPDWLAAVAAIELVQCVTQHEYDFFLNRGVPEFMLFILGQKLSKKDREALETSMRATIGLGNQHKSMLVNLPAGADTMRVQLEKLAIESKSDGSQFAGMAESLALQIVSAHGVPPLLAGIQIPGKLGASNEMVQAMQAFQTLVIEPAQRLFRRTLYNTLGKEAGLGLSAEDFVLNTITDAIDVQKTDTIARMRQSPQEAEAEGRDLDDGMKKSFEEWTDEERGAVIGEALDHLLDRLTKRAA